MLTSTRYLISFTAGTSQTRHMGILQFKPKRKHLTDQIWIILGYITIKSSTEKICK